MKRWDSSAGNRQREFNVGAGDKPIGVGRICHCHESGERWVLVWVRRHLDCRGRGALSLVVAPAAGMDDCEEPAVEWFGDGSRQAEAIWGGGESPPARQVTR